MTASTSDRMAVSNMTLVLAEVSGWYKPNYAMAEQLFWGKNAGCNFLTGPCLAGSPLVAQSEEFCAVPSAKGCDLEANSAGLCWTGTGTLSNSVWNYFGNGTLAPDSFSDNCPKVVGYSNRFCGPGGTAGGYSPEHFGTDSACFVSAILYNNLDDYPAQGQCYQYQV